MNAKPPPLPETVKLTLTICLTNLFCKLKRSCCDPWVYGSSRTSFCAIN